MQNFRKTDLFQLFRQDFSINELISHLRSVISNQNEITIYDFEQYCKHQTMHFFSKLHNLNRCITKIQTLMFHANVN